jgi:hypothetical protein
MLVRLRRRPLPLHALRSGDLALDFAHRYWHERRDGPLLPSRSDVDTSTFRLLLDNPIWIDVRPPDAAAWDLGRLGALLRASDSRSAPSGEAENLHQDLEGVCFTGAPLLQDLIVSGPHGAESWRQLVLPHADDGCRVRDLLVLLVRRALSPVP